MSAQMAPLFGVTVGLILRPPKKARDFFVAAILGLGTAWLAADELIKVISIDHNLAGAILAMSAKTVCEKLLLYVETTELLFGKGKYK